MISSNGHYGHRAILSRYAGLGESLPIPGLVEHGWNYDLGATLEDVLLPGPDPFFLWSERNLRNAKEAGLQDRIVPLGAPFLYMPPVEAPIEPEPRSLLVMPAHGWEKNKVEHDFEQYARNVEEISRDFSSITVCLYWFEFREERYRKPFEARGYKVVTAGPRDNNPQFLYDLRKLLLKYEYISSNRVQTATFYALSLGRKFFAHGPPVGIEQRIDRTGQLYDAWQHREFPTLMWKNFHDEPQPAIAASELGAAFVKTKDELLDLFCWRPERSREREARVAAFKVRNEKRIRDGRVKVWRDAIQTLPVLRRYLPR